MTRILIIEDEARAARELASMLTAVDPDTEILTILDSVELSVQWLNSNHHPDLIFSDIQLADGLCFDIYNKVQVQSPVIFCTAFDEYLMNAFDMHTVSYLLKPITKQKLEKALDKFYALRSVFNKQQDTGFNVLLEQLRNQYKTALLVHEKDKIIPLQVKDIAFIYLDKSLLSVTTSANKKYYLSSSLDELEKSLDPSSFYRANRQFLINRTSVANAERFFARKLVVRLTVQTPETVVISKAKASEFLQWLSGI